ncbi:heme peroxidase [Ochromonadaceae sp. CCMP2298]|nr:heme peroxidase [Ochromonadaceae sp. CCMP2298]
MFHRALLKAARARPQTFRSFSGATHTSGNAQKYAIYVAVGFSLGLAAALNQHPAECGIFGPDIKKAKQDIVAAIEADDEKRADGTSIGPTLIRLAWHASGTYSAHSKTGGSSGAGMRFAPEAEWGANAGLKGTRDFLESIKKKHGLSYGDTWTLAGVTAVEMMGGPEIKWRPGRKDLSAVIPPLNYYVY